jgi:hypothetical protein
MSERINNTDLHTEHLKNSKIAQWLTTKRMNDNFFHEWEKRILAQQLVLTNRHLAKIIVDIEPA